MNFPGQSLDGFVNARSQANALLYSFDALEEGKRGLGLGEALVLQASYTLLSRQETISVPSIFELVPSTENNVRRALTKFEEEQYILISIEESEEYRRSHNHFGHPRRLYTPTDFGHLILMCFEPKV